MDAAAVTRSRIAQLAHALDAQQWSKAHRLIQAVPTCLDKQSSAQQMAATLDYVRAAADTIREACDFSTSFEAAYVTRRALLRRGVVSWAVRALDGFAHFAQLVAKLAAVLQLLGIGIEGRCLIGSASAVDKLTLLWATHPSCVELVSALLSLCAGHIDNVSRFMRRRGISKAVHVLTHEQHRLNPKLVQQTLVLIGFCAVCTPDNQVESAVLVPAILQTLENALEDDDLDAAVHSLIALANIGDCWTKEALGYELDDIERLLTCIILVWQKHVESRRLGAAASWALSALSTGHPSVKPLLHKHAQDILHLCSASTHVGSALQFLQDMLRAVDASSTGTRADCTCESEDVDDTVVESQCTTTPPCSPKSEPPRDAQSSRVALSPATEKHITKKRRRIPRRSRLLCKSATATDPSSHEAHMDSPVRIVDLTESPRRR